MSPRTAKYVEAMIGEGDSFEYDRWLKKAREEEADAKRAAGTAGTSGELVPATLSNPISTSDGQHNLPKPTSRLTQLLRSSRSPRPHEAKSQTPNALMRWLKKVRRASGESQASRRRDAVYEYLAAVFAIVEHFKVRRRTGRLLRHAFKFANLAFDKNADPFSAVLRCTSSNAVDTKTISKYARALRYASRHKKLEIRLKTFMKEAGGVNACANLYAKYYGRCTRHF